MQSVFLSYAATDFGAGRNEFAQQLQLLARGEFYFKMYSFRACGFVMSVPYCLDKGS